MVAARVAMGRRKTSVGDDDEVERFLGFVYVDFGVCTSLSYSNLNLHLHMIHHCVCVLYQGEK